MCIQSNSLRRKISTLEREKQNLQGTVNVLQEKINEISSIVGNKEDIDN